MPRDMIFNSSSLVKTKIETLEEAKKVFESFVSTVAFSIDEDLCSTTIRSQIFFQDAHISIGENEHWSIGDWLCDESIDRETRSFLLTLDAKVPVESGIDLDAEIEDQLLAADFHINSVDTPSCFEAGICLYYDGIMCSLSSSPLWATNTLQILMSSADGNLTHSVIDHFSCESHVGFLNGLRQAPANLANEIITDMDFIARKSEKFTNLRFSPDVDKQIPGLTARQISSLVSKLKLMDDTCEHWAKNQLDVPSYQFFWRNESVSTMQKYRKQRLYTHPDGGKSIFESHADFSDSHRIHFIVDFHAKQIVIGYIGNHLPTTKFN